MDEVSLLENGFDYILNSLNNLKVLELGTGNKYTIKYIIRDLISGIEIILKYRLVCDNWTYVIDNLDRLSIDDYSKGDFVSVTLEQAINRLKSLCKIVVKDEDEKKLKELKLIRNKIEHFKLILKESETISLVYNSITVIFNFIDKDNKNFKDKFTDDEKKLYLEIKCKVLELNNYLNEREKEIKAKYPKIDFETCYFCHRKCLKVDGINCECFLCLHEYQDTIYERKKYIDENCPSYRDISKGSSPIEEIECPYCGDVMLLDYDRFRAICYACKIDSDLGEFDYCERCGKIGINGFCENCLADLELTK